MNSPPLVIFAVIEPKTRSDQDKLGHGLRKLMVEDPTSRLDSDPKTGNTIIRAISELQLESIIERLKRELKVDVTVSRPQIAYKETVTRMAEGEGRCVQQITGRGHYALVRIRVSPGNAGTGYIFESQVGADVIPKKFIKSIDEGIAQAVLGGVLAGYPVDDVRVKLFDGSFHEVDSSEMAFQIAGTTAFQDAATRAAPVLLEPIMAAELVVPDEYLGNVIGDLNSRRGRIEGMELRGTMQIIKSSVPLSEMLGYGRDLSRRTEGRATHAMQFDRYEPRPGGPPNNDGDLAPVIVPRTPTPKGRESGVALPEPDNE